MSVGLKVGFFWYEIGTGDFLHSFFSTVSYHLENKEWGTVYPVLMEKLYRGSVDTGELEELKKELSDVEQRLRSIPPDRVIWDIEDLSRQPPWGKEISDDIKDLSDYFITSNGGNIFDMFRDAVSTAKTINSGIEIKSYA